MLATLGFGEYIRVLLLLVSFSIVVILVSSLKELSMIKYSWYRWVKRLLGYRTFVHDKGDTTSYMSFRTVSGNVDDLVEELLYLGWVEETDARLVP